MDIHLLLIQVSKHMQPLIKMLLLNSWVFFYIEQLQNLQVRRTDSEYRMLGWLLLLTLEFKDML